MNKQKKNLKESEDNGYKDLQSQIDSLKEMIGALTNVVSANAKTTIKEDSEKFEDSEIELIDIPINKVIKVMSLYTGGLNLKTSDSGKIFRFNNFGDVQPIVYNDLLQIMAFQSRFLKDGYFMILDKDVVKLHNLEETYKKFLTKKQIENILEFEDEAIRNMLNNTSKSIKESVVTILANKINSNDNVDKNKIHLIGEICDVDIFAYSRNDVVSMVNKNQ